MMQRISLLVAVLGLFASGVFATVFGTVRGVVHDPQHKPVAAIRGEAEVGDIRLDPNGANGPGWRVYVHNGAAWRLRGDGDQGRICEMQQTVTVISGSSPILHFPLTIAAVNQTTLLWRGHQDMANVDSVTPTTLVNREEIAQTPGATVPIALR